MKLVFATNNQHKLQEVRQVLPTSINILSLKDINCFEDIPEEQETLKGNALQKARFVKNKYGFDCFADDTGLEIDALKGKPGVYSARYAGPARDFNKNMDKVLAEMSGMENRNARFRTVIALLLNGQEYFFEGAVEGTILNEKRGEEGFGYDPVFQAEGFVDTFAEMDLQTKNRISHRGRAVKKLVEFLNRRSSE